MMTFKTKVDVSKTGSVHIVMTRSDGYEAETTIMPEVLAGTTDVTAVCIAVAREVAASAAWLMAQEKPN